MENDHGKEHEKKKINFKASEMHGDQVKLIKEKRNLIYINTQRKRH